MRVRLLLTTLVLGLTVVACSSTDTTDAVAITATDSVCEVAQTDLLAGDRTFEVNNEGDQVTEVYVYAEGDRVVTEKENIGPGTSATFTADLAAGNYEIACKPGQKGDGIRRPITVTGSGGAAAKPADREVELSAGDYTFTGMESFSAKTGETIKFEIKNTGQLEHEFEILTPASVALGEIGPTKPGAEGDVTLTFTEPGTYRYICDIDNHQAMGMAGTFVVT